MKVYKIISNLIPRKKWRHQFRDYYKRRNILKEININYQRHLSHLRQKSRIKVAFLVWENSKWSYDKIYQKLKTDNTFVPIVCLIKDTKFLCPFDQNKDFFKKKNYDYCIINNRTDLEKLKPEIVFYEQPWPVLGNELNPRHVSRFALCLYAPYNIELGPSNTIFSKTKPFYQRVYQTFVFNKVVQQNIAKYGVTNTICSGHPKLDAYADPISSKSIWKTHNKMRIIFAPHHSFRHTLQKWATYEWSGQPLLQLAHKYAKETEWIFKPHARLYLEMSNEFGKEYADTVFDQWAEISHLYDRGDYFDLFKTADLMISDCSSFKIEWLPTGKPYIHLVSNYPDADPEPPLKSYFMKGYYWAHNPKELDDYFHQLVLRKQDPLKPVRQNLIKEIPLNASDFIVNYVKRLSKDQK